MKLPSARELQEKDWIFYEKCGYMTRIKWEMETKPGNCPMCRHTMYFATNELSPFRHEVCVNYWKRDPGCFPNILEAW